MSSSNQQINDSTFLLTSGRARLWAILVGVTHYQDDAFSELNYSAADCRALGEAIVAATQQFPNRRIAIHHNFTTPLPTLEAVRESLRYVVSRAMLQDTILFYFSGHGVVEPNSQEAVLCLSDTRNTALLGTGLQMNELLQMLEECDAGQQIVWLDACHSGELSIQGAKGGSRYATLTKPDEPTAQFVKVLRTRASQSKGFYAMLSCDQGQRSWEFPELGHGLFTYFLIRGLQGEAADPEGVIAADALYRYVYTQTTAFIQQKNRDIQLLNEQRRAQGETLLYPEYPLQTPKRIIEGVGELVVGLQPEAIVASTPPTAPSAKSLPGEGQPTVWYERISETAFGRLQGWQRFLWLVGGVAGIIFVIASTIPRLVRSPQTAQIETASSADAQICNVKAERLNETNAPVNPQVVLNSCAAGQQWQQPKVQILANSEPAWSTAFEPGERTLISVGGKEGGEIWDLESSQPIRSFKGHTDNVYEVAISPDGETIATASADQTIKLWNPQTGELLRTLTGHTAPIWTVAISPDGETIASGSADRTIKLWNLQTGALIRTLEGHTNRIFTVAFTPDGQTLLSGSEDQTIKQWNVQTGQALQTLTGHTDTVRAVAVSPDGQRFASASWDQSIKLWDVQTGQELQTLTGHTDRVFTLAFSPDSQTLASGSRDQSVRLWDLTSNTLIGSFFGHDGWVLSVEFSSDGQTLVSSGLDGTIVLWQP
jgi:WD40 repeat protein/uncharacterized caspase-like protein